MVMIVGHRGARGLWPENSLDGFRRLGALGVEAVEFDVQQTRDGGLAVIHDPSLDRTTSSTGVIRDLDAAQVFAAPLRQTEGDAPAADECVPSLESVLDLLAPGQLELHVEIKTDAMGELAPGMIEGVVRAVHDRGLQSRAVLTCFVPDILVAIRQVWPAARLLASLDQRSAELLGGLDAALSRFGALHGCIVAVEKKLLAAGWSTCFERLGSARLGVWVINEADEIERWIDMPLRQITTDRPDRLLAARAVATR